MFVHPGHCTKCTITKWHYSGDQFYPSIHPQNKEKNKEKKKKKVLPTPVGIKKQPTIVIMLGYT